MTAVIGLTGGVAAGKSTVSAMLRQLGATVLDADVAARLVVEPGTEGLQEIVRHFGPRVLRSDGTLDRRALGDIVFSDAAKRAALEAIVHPRVFEWMQARLAERDADVPLVALDIPLLFETERGLALCEKTVVVWVPEQTQLERLMSRDNLSEEAAWQRIRAQMPIDRKKELADFVIDNSGSLASTKQQVQHLWKLLTSRQKP